MTSNLPTVSVIIPARGSAHVLPRALESIGAQTYPNVLEVVVAAADDASAEVAEAAGATVVDNEVGFTRNQDYELNHRLIETGDIVGFDPELRVQYRPRGSPPFGSPVRRPRARRMQVSPPHPAGRASLETAGRIPLDPDAPRHIDPAADSYPGIGLSTWPISSPSGSARVGTAQVATALTTMHMS